MTRQARISSDNEHFVFQPTQIQIISLWTSLGVWGEIIDPCNVVRKQTVQCVSIHPPLSISHNIHGQGCKADFFLADWAMIHSIKSVFALVLALSLSSAVMGCYYDSDCDYDECCDIGYSCRYENCNNVADSRPDAAFIIIAVVSVIAALLIWIALYYCCRRRRRVMHIPRTCTYREFDNIPSTVAVDQTTSSHPTLPPPPPQQQSGFAFPPNITIIEHGVPPPEYSEKPQS